MSSDEEDQRGPARPASKRQRRGVACDMCRKRKLKCNGKQAGTGKCTNCSDHQWDCTLLNAPGKKVAAGYIEALETKVKKLQSLINRMLPGQDFEREVGFELTRDNWMLPGVCGAPEPEHPSAFVAGPVLTPGITPNAASSTSFSAMASGHATPKTPTSDDEHSSDEEDRRQPAIKLQNLRGASQWVSWSHHITIYLGKSLGTGLIKNAFEMCKELLPDITTNDLLRFRSKVWERPLWLDDFGNLAPPRPTYFPDNDLVPELVALYFANFNILSPVLHRPTFEENLRSSLHLRDRSFGSVVLLVCALGSRYSHNPRVLANGDKTWLSAGWKWFTQTQVLDDATLVSPASHLHVLQATCLSTIYVSHVSLTHAWMYIGAGIRLAVDIGAHKRRTYGAKPTLEDEMFKRAFWILVFMDRTMCMIMGRPSCIQEEDFDLDMVLCCDDEFLTHEDPEWIGKQPSDKPSVLSYFVWSLKLAQIQGLALRTLYASTKAKAHFNFQGEEWLTRTVAHFDSLLNNWIDSVPEHLRWNPAIADDAFLKQSAQLYLQYYTTQIVVHRSFLNTPARAPVSFPSLAISTSAARSMVRIASVMHERKKDHVGNSSWMIQNAALVTLVSLGHARLGNITLDRKQALADVDTIISILREGETRWRWSGRQADVVESVRVLGEASTDELPPAGQRKRSRGANGPVGSAATSSQLGVMSEPTAALPQPQAPLQDDLSTTNWNSSSSTIFGHNDSDNDFAPYAMDYSHEPLPRNTGTVLGNIDFGALFGFGDAGSDLRPWSPAPFDGTVNMPLTGTQPSSSGEGLSFEFGPEDWSGMSFDYGSEDWRWMAPQQDMGQSSAFDPGQPRH